MFTFKSSPFKIQEELLLSSKAFVRLFERNRSSILSARFVPAKLGSREIGGYVRVKLRPGTSYASKPNSATK